MFDMEMSLESEITYVFIEIVEKEKRIGLGNRGKIKAATKEGNVSRR